MDEPTILVVPNTHNTIESRTLSAAYLQRGIPFCGQASAGGETRQDGGSMLEWANFYTLMGTGAATLVGLTFLALTMGSRVNSPERIRYVPLFVTPTVVHFSMVLLISAAMLIPSLAAEWSAGFLGLAGLICTVYMAWLGRQFFRSPLEAVFRFTWVWHAGTLGLIYLGLVGAAGWNVQGGRPQPGAIAAVALALMAVALRDSWATVEWTAAHSDRSSRD